MVRTHPHGTHPSSTEKLPPTELVAAINHTKRTLTEHVARVRALTESPHS